MNKFKSTADTLLRDVVMTPEMTQAAKGQRTVRKKGIPALALTCVLVLAAAAALAITTGELIKRKMEPVAEMHLASVFDNWGLETKADLIAHVQSWGLEADAQKLAAVWDTELDDATREQAADEIIYSVFTKAELEVLQSEYPDVEQPEVFPAPSDYIIFRVLWQKESPDSTEDEIKAAFDEWEAETAARVSAGYVPPVYASSEEEIRALFELDMSEILSMNRSERAAARIDIAPIDGYPLWQVTMTVQGDKLRDSTKETLKAVSVLAPEAYRTDTDSYTHVVLYEETENNVKRVPDAQTVAEYEYQKLNDSLVWPGSEEDIHGNYHRFLAASAAEKAAFSAQAKPIVKEWYTGHAEFARLLANAYNEGAKTDTLYAVTLHTYGIPANNALSEQDIRRLAAETYAGLFDSVTVDDVLGNMFEMYVWFDVTDNANPVWKVTAQACADTNPTGYMNYETRHMVFSPDGKLLRDGGEARMIAGVLSPAAPSVSSPLNEEDNVEF